MASDGAGRTDASAALEGIPQAGEVVGGKFVVERVLGVGGMGVVVAARHAQLGQQVAIKFLRPSAATSADAVSRFVREARAVVGLQSAHVVRVTDVGALEDGLPYMVMEHLSGTDLGHVLEVRRMLPIDEAVDYVLQSIEAIAEAHALGIVHRDLKPSNLFLTLRPDGAPLVKVLDFGISKAVQGEPSSLTETAVVLGSPLYMSPEQVRSTRNVDTRTDIWALGVILYELLTGVPPFEAETVTGLCAKIVADPPTSLRSRRPDVPAALDSVIARCLEKSVARRPRTVADLAAALRPFASAEGKLGVERIARIGAGLRTSLSGFPEPTRAPRGPRGGGSDIPTGYAETVATHPTSGRQLRLRATSLAAVFVAVALAGVWLSRGVGPAARDSRRPALEQANVEPPESPVPGAVEPGVAFAPATSPAPPPLSPSLPAPAPSPPVAAAADTSVTASPPSPPSALVEAGRPWPLLVGPVTQLPSLGRRPPAALRFLQPRTVPGPSTSSQPNPEELLLERK